MRVQTDSAIISGRQGVCAPLPPLTSSRRTSSAMADKTLFQIYSESNKVSRKAVDLTGKKFNLLTVIEFFRKENE